MGDEHSDVRTDAIYALTEYYNNHEGLFAVYELALKDSSYEVISAALISIAKQDSRKGLEIAKQFESESNQALLSTVAEVYASYGTDKQHPFFIYAINQISGFFLIEFLVNYETYLLAGRSEKTINDAVSAIAKVVQKKHDFYIRLFALQVLKNLRDHYEKQEFDLNTEISKLESTNPEDPGLIQMLTLLQKTSNHKSVIVAEIDNLRKEEKTEKMKIMYED